MPQFTYEGFDQSGGKVRATVEAPSQAEAAKLAADRGVVVASVRPASSGEGWREWLGLAERPVDLADLEFVTAELSLLLDSGVRIDRAIGILQRAGKSPAVARLLGTLAAQLKQGRQLSEAMSDHPAIFDKLYVNLVSLGEASGRLPAVFVGLAEDLAFQRDLRQKIISAATYPLVVAGVCVAALVFILNFVVPNLETLFTDTSELPWYTAMLLGASEFMREWQLPLAVVVGVVAASIYRVRHSAAVVEFRDRLLLDTPLLRDITCMVERIRFTSGLALMLGSGLSVDRALSLATGNVRHGTLRREVAAAVEKVKRGEQISIALRQTRLFPDYFASLLEVGEESGQLAKAFGEISRRSRDVFSAATLRLTTLLEPMLILVMGLIVGGVVVVMMLSITSVTEVAG
jgi:type II secretory pathway component PulF